MRRAGGDGAAAAALLALLPRYVDAALVAVAEAVGHGPFGSGNGDWHALDTVRRRPLASHRRSRSADGRLMACAPGGRWSPRPPVAPAARIRATAVSTAGRWFAAPTAVRYQDCQQSLDFFSKFLHCSELAFSLGSGGSPSSAEFSG